jgi:uncharacterized SAM-dependent methyltransferase
MPALKHPIDDERASAAAVDIIDIRGNETEIDLKNEVIKLLQPKEGPRKLPTLLLYDEKGLQLFEDASFCPPLPPSSCFVSSR